MFWAGIDFSMSSPAITVGYKQDFSTCKTFFYTPKAKYEGVFGSNIYGMMASPYEHQMERFDNLAIWTLTILQRFKVTEVCLEDYSYGSKGNVFNIGENTGIMKHLLWKNNIKYYTAAPTQIKKSFSGKGNANKEDMHEAFETETGLSVAKLLNAKAKDSPVSDIVDSYAVFKYGMEHHF